MSLLAAQVAETRDDVASLEAELANLGKDRDMLQRQVELLEAGGGAGGGGGGAGAEILQHQYFDKLILPFFDELATGLASGLAPGLAPAEEQAPAPADVPPGAHELAALLENIHRLGGVTAFPLNDRLLAADELVGLRFEVYAARRFHTPHYVILRREHAKGGARAWRVFKHTLPAFLAAELEPPDDYRALASRVRAALWRLQHRHDKLDQLALLGFAVERDLQCRRVTIARAPLTLVATCADTYIAEVEVSGAAPADAARIAAMLTRCEFTHLVKTFRQLHSTQ